jgi:hypothetical protein
VDKMTRNFEMVTGSAADVHWRIQQLPLLEVTEVTGSTWRCPSCTLENHRSVSSCAACGKARAVLLPDRPSSGWTLWFQLQWAKQVTGWWAAQAKSNLLLSDRCSAANVYEITKQVADVTRQDLPWKSHEIWKSKWARGWCQSEIGLMVHLVLNELQVSRNSWSELFDTWRS